MGGAYRSKTTLTGNNYFPTYHSLTRLLMEKVDIEYNPDILEPSAGAGDISKIVKEFFPCSKLTELDIEPRREGILEKDFFDYTIEHDYIISNPPYNIFMAWYKHAVTLFRKKMWLLLPLDYLHGIERYDEMYLNESLLKTVHIFVRRPLFSSEWRADGKIPTGATTFAFFEFDKSNKDIPNFKWLDNRFCMGKPTHVDTIEFKI